MATKSKKSRPFFTWLCFFLAVNFLGIILFTGLGFFIHSGGNWEIFKSPFQADFKKTPVFKERTGYYFKELILLVSSISPENQGHPQFVRQYLNDEGQNLKYFAVNEDTGMALKNFDPAFSKSGKPILPADYEYYWYFDGRQTVVMHHGRVDVQRLDSGYRDILPDPRHYTDDPDQLVNSRILLAVRNEILPNPYAHSRYFGDQQLLTIAGWTYILLGLAGLLLLVCSVVKRREKRQFDLLLASRLNRLGLEVKILVSLGLMAVPAIFGISMSGGSRSILHAMLPLVVIGTALLTAFWWIYLLVLDLTINKSSFFSNNLITFLTKHYSNYEKRYAWQKMMLNRAWVMVIAEGVLALVSVIFLVAASLAGDWGLLLIGFLLAGAGVYLLYRYFKRFQQTVEDLGRLVQHIERMKNGDMATRLEFPEDHDMYPAAQNLNSIQEGLSIAVAERLKSERLKIDLITNVSHDLKTPLTSIIGYVELLSREENLPAHVDDYIKILSQKSERLKNLIQDLFDLSRASSENITMDMEKIDLARLIKQTLADMEEQISDSGLTFRIIIPDRPVYIVSDGKKLYRVWENLISNALKYSLADSRVYVDLVVDEQGALATIKNIANYEMVHGEEELLQRFVRGDDSRSTEGSGLGLSIAQSFTQVCGGRLTIKMDGDLFKVELRFSEVLDS